MWSICVYVPLCAGPGAAESPQSLQRGAGLREGLPELHLRVHLQQLPGALQPAVPARRPAGEEEIFEWQPKTLQIPEIHLKSG